MEQISLEDRIVADKSGNKIHFKSLHLDQQKIIRQLYEQSEKGSRNASYRMIGTLGGDNTHLALDLVHLWKDFFAGKPEKNGEILQGSSQGKISIGYGWDNIPTKYDDWGIALDFDKQIDITDINYESGEKNVRNTN